METSQTKESLQEEIPETVTSKQPNDTSAPKGTWIGQPKGLFPLAGTEVWERFSFYGMKDMLVLFLTAAIAKGGLGMAEKTANVLAPLYAALALLVCIPSGWLTDRGMSPRKAVLWGASLQCMGHLMLGLGGNLLFVSGLWFLILGTGLLKSNISSMVGDLYQKGDKRRDRGFSIFYQGINFGAMLGPLLVAEVRVRWGFHPAFSVAGIGMLFSLATFVWGFRYYTPPSVAQKEKEQQNPHMWIFIPITMLLGLALIWLLRNSGLLSDRTLVEKLGNIVTVLGALLVIGMLFFFYHKSQGKVERDCVIALGCISLGIVAFSAVFELASTLFTTFTKKHIDGSIFGIFTIKPEQFGMFNPFFIITMAVPLTNFWIWVKHRHPKLSIITKIGVGLLLTALSCVVLVFAGKAVEGSSSSKISSIWMAVIYFLQTLAELCVYTTALSFITKIAPEKMKRSYMAFIWMIFSLGSSCSGVLGSFASGSTNELVSSFTSVGICLTLMGICFILGNNIINKLLHGVEDIVEDAKKSHVAQSQAKAE